MSASKPAAEAPSAGRGLVTGTRYAFVCRGPHCTRRDSRLLRDQLRDIVAARGTPDAVVSSYPCFGLCDDGPNAFVYPDAVWYSDLSQRDLEGLAEHLATGAPHVEKQVHPDVTLTENVIENIRESWDLMAKRAKRGFRLWPFGK